MARIKTSTTGSLIMAAFAIAIFLLASRVSHASCIELISDRIESKKSQLLRSKSREKKILKIVAVSTFTPTALVMGTAAKLIIDGGTIGTAIIVGSSFGAFVGAGAVTAIAVPMITYNQILKAEIRGMGRTLELLTASASQNLENNRLKRLIERVKRMRPEITTTQILYMLNSANRDLLFCAPDARVAGLKKIEKHLLNRATGAEDSEASLILLE